MKCSKTRYSMGIYISSKIKYTKQWYYRWHQRFFSFFFLLLNTICFYIFIVLHTGSCWDILHAFSNVYVSCAISDHVRNTHLNVHVFRMLAGHDIMDVYVGSFRKKTNRPLMYYRSARIYRVKILRLTWVNRNTYVRDRMVSRKCINSTST